VIFICLFLISVNNLGVGGKSIEKINKCGEIKLESLTTIEWFRMWGVRGNGVAVDRYNNCYLVGIINNDAFIVKYNKDGNVIWNQTWGRTGDDEGYAVTVDPNQNSCYITGTTEGLDLSKTDGFLVKYDLNGTFLWNLTWGGANSDGGMDIVVDSFGYCYIAGVINKCNEFSGDGILIKFDTDGNQLWNRTYGGLGLEDGTGVAIDSGNYCYFAGTTASFAVDYYDMYLVKYTSSGVQVWNKTYDCETWDRCFGLAIDGWNNSYLVGDPGLLKVDPMGNPLWRQTLAELDDPLVTNIAIDSKNNCYITGFTMIDDIFDTLHTAFIVKFDASGNALGHRLIDNGDGLYWGSGIAVDAFNNFYVAGNIYWERGFLFVSNILYPQRISGFEWLFLFILGEIIGLILIEMKYRQKITIKL
jgi:hypothetical protein